MVVAGVLKFDHSHVQRFHDRDVTQGAALIDLNTATQAELETLPWHWSCFSEAPDFGMSLC